MKRQHPTFKDDRGSFMAIDSKFLDINWELFNIGTNENKYTARR